MSIGLHGGKLQRDFLVCAGGFSWTEQRGADAQNTLPYLLVPKLNLGTRTKDVLTS